MKELRGSVFLVRRGIREHVRRHDGCSCLPPLSGQQQPDALTQPCQRLDHFGLFADRDGLEVSTASSRSITEASKFDTRWSWLVRMPP